MQPTGQPCDDFEQNILYEKFRKLWARLKKSAMKANRHLDHNDWIDFVITTGVKGDQFRLGNGQSMALSNDYKDEFRESTVFD